VASADAADQHELFFESLTRAMYADGCVASGDAGVGGEGFKAFSGEVHVAQNLVVSRFKSGEHLADALADDCLGLRVGCGFGEVVRPALEGSVFGGAAAVVIDDGVAEDAVEPGDGGLVAAQSGGLLDGADVGTLNDVFCGCGGFDAPLHEAKELASLEDEVGDSFCWHRLRMGGAQKLRTTLDWLVGCWAGADDATGAG
jgi:hypothetical protein